MRLNKYLAHCGLGTRRQADTLILKGKVKVNGEVVKNPALAVAADDVVLYDDKKVYVQKGKAYILMNKPKLFDCEYDVSNNKSIAKLIHKKYANVVVAPLPLRLIDRGLILLTDDESVLEKFAAENHTIKQIYQLTLDQPITTEHLGLLASGVVVDGDTTKLASADYVEDEPKHIIGVTTHHTSADYLHSVLAALGYEVLIADRTYIGGLTKKNLPRGFFRDLTEKEIVFLRHFL